MDRKMLSGQVTARDVEVAKVRAETLRGQYEIAVQELQPVVARERRTRLTEARLLRLLAFRRWLDHSISRTGGMLVLVTVCVAISVVVTHAFFPTIPVYVVPVASATYAGVAVAFAAIYPNDRSLTTSMDNLSIEAHILGQQIETQRRELEVKRVQLDAANEVHLRLLNTLNSRLHKLLTCPWQGFAGLQFEQFLEQVFLENGYDVSLTGQTGDQGVDLIVSMNGRRIAIQAKGYPGSTVGNSAIQEVHAGMTHHRCQFSVVVTNSRFTKSAVNLANSVNCRLIDGSQISALINGQLRL